MNRYLFALLVSVSFFSGHLAYSESENNLKAGPPEIKRDSSIVARRLEKFTNWDPTLSNEDNTPIGRAHERVAQREMENKRRLPEVRVPGSVPMLKKNANEKQMSSQRISLHQPPKNQAQRARTNGINPPLPSVAMENKLAVEEDPFRNLTNENAVIHAQKQLLIQLHAINLMQIHLGELAQKKGNSYKIKAYGRRLVMDHRFADEQVLELAKEQDLALSDNATTSEITAMKRLGALDGIAFEKAFLDQVTLDHQTTVLLLKSLRGDLPAHSYVSIVVDRLVPIFGQHYEVSQVLKYK